MVFIFVIMFNLVLMGCLLFFKFMVVDFNVYKIEVNFFFGLGKYDIVINKYDEVFVVFFNYLDYELVVL